MIKTFSFLLFSLTVFISFSGCKYGKAHIQKQDIKEFEGIITYHEILKNRDSLLNVDDTVKVFYAHGNYVGVHSEGSEKFHLVKDYYFEDKPLRLLLFNNSDTLYQMSLNFPIEKLERFKVTKINNQVLSKQCERIDLNTSYAENDSVTYSDFSFIFSRGYLNVKKEHFKNWNLGYFNKVVNECGTLYLSFKAVHFDSSYKNILSVKTYDIISVKEQPVDPKIFEIDPSKIKSLNNR
ncbi:hypothetical protein G7074_09030 [Pedobacter sp. HDW13]|uniref:hypothetical protein n=1 Tax=unclassified Pedobacter TaxID=2628915 RepID=UPI000F59EA03|nr:MULTISPECIES: hypothetical protein [unclassified Pedobacter]QIL39406.1 hypothetical protein G7074_09030 [Pedobacter sp. HDW13]